jgi:hypothetical protein
MGQKDGSDGSRSDLANVSFNFGRICKDFCAICLTSPIRTFLIRSDTVAVLRPTHWLASLTSCLHAFHNQCSPHLTLQSAKQSPNRRLPQPKNLYTSHAQSFDVPFVSEARRCCAPCACHVSAVTLSPTAQRQTFLAHKRQQRIN